MKYAVFMFVSLISCLVFELSYGEIIRYTDKDGILCFADDLGSVPKKYRKNIIRDEEERAEQIINSETESSVITSAGNSGKEIVRICSGLSGLDSLGNGHNLTCFLDARDYPYRLLNVTDNPSNTKACAEYWCRLNKNNDSAVCIKETADRIHWIMPFTVIGNNLHPGTKSNILKEIDLHFNADPDSPVKYNHRPPGE